MLGLILLTYAIIGIIWTFSMWMRFWRTKRIFLLTEWIVLTLINFFLWPLALIIVIKGS